MLLLGFNLKKIKYKFFYYYLCLFICLDQKNDFSITVDRYMEVSFRDIGMNIFKINISPLDDILDVKKLIHEKINFEICYQRLVFGQKNIDDG